MKHIHFKSCDSTQKYLIELDKAENQSYLVSTDAQLHGIGQRQNTWLSDEGSLCLSLVTSANEVLSLTALEIGIIICEFFSKQNLKLKWPNDLMNKHGQKVGGILINKKGDADPVIGIGLNLFSNIEVQDSNAIKPGTIFDEEFSFKHEDLAKEIFEWIINHRLSPSDIRKKFLERCFHINQDVRLIEGEVTIIGKFTSIGEYGEALLEIEGQTRSFVSGSIRF